MDNQIQTYLAKLDSNPSDRGAMASLVEAFTEEGNLTALVALLTERAADADSPAQRAQLLVRAGDVAAEAGDAEASEGLYQQALSLNGEGGAQWDAQAGLLQLKGDYASVVELRQQQLSAAGTESERAEALCLMGYVYRDKLGDQPNAMKAFQAAFKMDRACLEALVAAREIYAVVGNWKLVAQLLKLELGQVQALGDPARVASVLVTLGDVCGERLDDPKTAEVCYTNALQHDPSNLVARARVQGLGYDVGSTDEASEEPAEPESDEEPDEPEADEEANAAASIMAGAGATEPMREVPPQELEAADGTSDPPTYAEEVAEEEDVADVASADEASADEASVDEASADEASAEEASAEEASADEASADEASAEEASADEASAEEASADEASADEASADEASADEASAEEASADEASAEEASAEEASAEEASADEASADEASADEAGSDEAIVEDAGDAVAEADAESASADEGEAVAESADAEEASGEEAGGGDVAEEAPAAEEPAATPAADDGAWRDRVDRLVAAATAGEGDWADALRVQATHAPTDSAILGLLDQAIASDSSSDAWYEALRGRLEGSLWDDVAQAFDAAASGGDASGALERQSIRVRLYERHDYDGARAATEALAADGRGGNLVEEISDAGTGKKGSWRRLQQELETRHAALSAEDKAVAVYGRVAEIARALGQDERRTDALRHLVQGAPHASAERAQLKQIYARSERWQNYVELVKQEVEVVTDEGEKLSLLWEMIRVYRDVLSLDIMVINTFNQLLQVDPSNTDVLDQLATQYEKMRRFPDLIGVLQKRADAARSDEERISIHLRVARLFLEKFSNQAEAIKAFEAVLEIDGTHAEAVGHLKEMYEKRRDWEKLVGVHEREIAGLESADERGVRYKEVAELASTKLRKPARALELWQRVLEHLPTDLDALSAVESLYEREKDWTALADVSERRLDLIEDSAERVKVATKLGRLYSERLDRPDDAVRAWRRVLADAPSDRRATDSLKRLLIDAGDWDALEAFFADADDHVGYVRTLETLAGTVKDDTARVDLLFRAAQVWQSPLEKTDRAVRALERVLSIDGSNAAAAGALAPIYENAGDDKKLGTVLEISLAHLDAAEQPAETYATLTRLAQLGEGKLRNPEAAFTYYSRAFAIGSPEVEDPFVDIERVAEGLGTWDEVATVYSDRLDVLAAGEDREAERELRLRLGRVLHEELGRIEESLFHYEQVLAAWPEERRALAAQQEIFQKTGDWERLLGVYNRRLELTPEADARIALLEAKALIVEDYKESPADAVECFQEIVEIDPGHRGALGSLHRIFQQLSRYEELADTLRKEIALVELSPVSGLKSVDGQALSEEDAREGGILAESDSLATLVDLKWQLGAVASVALEGTEARSEAVAVLRDVLAIRPGHEEALSQMEGLGQDPDFSVQVAETLEPLYAATSDWDKLVASLETELEATDSGDIETRVGLLSRIGETLLDQMGAADRAFDAYGRALRVDPRSDDAGQRLEQIADAVDKWPEYVSLLEDIGMDLNDPMLLLAYRTRVAQVVEERLGDAARAQDAWRSVLEVEPDSALALEHLEELFRVGQQWNELDEVYGRRLGLLLTGDGEEEDESEEGPSRAERVEELRFSMAVLHEEMLDDTPGAIDIYRTVLSEDASNLRAAQALDRLFAVEGRYEELAENLQLQLGLVEDAEERRVVKCRLAALLVEHLYRVEDAVALYGEVLAEDAEFVDAREALEALIESHPDHQIAVVDVLEPLYRMGEDWEALTRVLEIRIGASHDPEVKVGHLHEAASIRETYLGDAPEAFDTFARALREDVTNEKSNTELYRLAGSTGMWGELVGVFSREVDEASDPDLMASLEMRIAAIQEEYLADVVAATDHYQRVLEHSPEHGGAIDNLERIYQSLEQWEDLVSILLRKAPLTEDVAARKELLFRAATIREDMLGDASDAIATFERALDLDAADGTAIENLERLYLGHERWTDLIELYQRKMGLAESDAERRELLFLTGAVYEEHLEDSYRAVDTYNAVLETHADDRDALSCLDRLYQKTEQWSSLLETLQRQIALTEEPAEVLGLKFRVGSLFEQHMADVPEAIETYRGILAEDSSHPETTNALQELVRNGEESGAAAEVLSPIYRESERWSELIDLYEIMVSVTDDPPRRAELLSEIGQTHELRLNDPARAFEAYVRALEVTPGDTGIADTLERLADELGAWDVLVEALSERVAALMDMEVARDLCLRIGRVQEVELHDVEAAIESFRRVLDFEPTDPTAISSLDRLYERAGMWRELADIIQEEILQTDDEDEQIALRFRLGRVYETALEEVEPAYRTYHDVLMSRPDHADALMALEEMFRSGLAVMEIGAILEPIYVEREAWADLVGVYLTQLDQRETADERFVELQRISELYRDKLDDKESAFEVLGSALAQRPGDEQTTAELEALAGELEQWEKLAHFYGTALETAQDPEDQRRLLLGISRIMDHRLGEAETAEAVYLRVLEMDPTDEDALEALDRIYTQYERWPELSEIIERRIGLSMEEDAVVELSYRLALLCQEQLGDLDKAVDTYNRILDIYPTHPEALSALESVYLSREEWEPLFSIYERQTELLAEDEAGRAEVFAKMAALADQMLMRPLDALDLWNRVLDLRPQDITALQSLQALYEREERWSELVDVLEREAEITGEPDRKVELLSRQGTLWLTELLNEDQSLAAWQKVLDIDLTNREALFACRDLYRRTGQYEQLVDVVQNIITLENIDSDELLELYVELGSIQGELLGNTQNAIAAWRAVLDINPAHKVALDSLEQLYSDAGEWEACVQILQQKVAVLDAMGDEGRLPDQIELQLRIADLWENKVSRKDEAIAAYDAVLDLEPSHIVASRALEVLYADTEQWDRLPDLYMTRVEHTDDPFERLELLRSAAQIYEEKLDHPLAALIYLCRAYMENPEDEQTAADLERLGGETGEWGELIETYSTMLAQVEGTPDAIALHMRIAGIYAEHVGDRDQAVAHYRSAQELDPENTEVLAQLEKIFEVEERWAELVMIIEMRADRTMEEDIRIDLYRKVGDLWDLQLGDPEQAIEAYKNILRLDESNIDALASLERIYEVSGSWTDLIEILGRKAAALYEPEDVVSLKHRIAVLWEEHVGSVERAVEAYRDVLAVDQTHAESLEALERLYDHLEKWPDLLDVYDLQLALAQSDESQVVVYRKTARVYEEEFRDLDRAVEQYGKILLIDQHNMDAIIQLVRLYEELERWDDLVQTYERHIEAVPEPATRAEVYGAMGAVYRTRLHDVYRAIESYRRILEIDPQNTDALYELASLYEETSDWENCLVVYETLAALVTDVDAGVELHYRMGRIREENLADAAGAEERYRFALELQPSYNPAIDALRGMYERVEDWQGVIAMLRTEEEYTRDLEQKAGLLCRIGQTYERCLGDEIRALDYYEQTIELSPANEEAAEPLADMYLRERRWERAQPLLELLVRNRGHDRANENLHLLHYNLGLCYEELGLSERALKEYGEAYELANHHLPTLMGMARLLYDRQDYDRAYKLYRQITRHHADELGESDLTELNYRSGRIKVITGEAMTAQEMFEAALAVEPYHADTLDAIVALHSDQGQWNRVAEYRRRQLELIQDPLERYTVLVEIGDIFSDQLGDVASAVQAYGEALQNDPHSAAVLHKLLNLYTKHGMWGEATQVLTALADKEDNTTRKAKYLYTIAVIQRDKVGDPLTAAKYFNASLDVEVNPETLKSFEAIDRILTDHKDWKGLERAYRQMLHRVKDLDGTDDIDNLKLLLWRNLGEIYRTRQENFGAAIEAYKIASKMRPDNTQIHEILADLYERTGSHPEDAIDEHKRLIAMSPFRIASYRALFNAYMKTGKYDEAWCMSSALTFLQSASAEEQQFYQQYLTPSPQAPRRALTPDQWRTIYHGEQDMLTSNIMAQIATYMRSYYAFDYKTWGVHKRKDQLDLNQQLPFCRIFQYTAQTLAIPQVPRVYLKRDEVVPMRNGNLDPTAFIVGPKLFQGTPEREVGFIIGRQMALARPEHYLGSGFFPTENLKALFMGAMQLTNPAMNFGANNPQFEQMLGQMKRMPPPVLMQIRKFMQQFFESGQNPNLSAWVKSVDHTANRAGLLICGDLLTAANSIKNDPVPISKLTVKERIKELVLFSISETHFTLRKELGLALGQQ